MSNLARRSTASWTLLVAMLLSLLPAAYLSPAVAQAQDLSPAAEDKTSADASEEIVYLDSNGFVRVLDVQFEPGKQITFVSPEGGWRDLALGDFNNDGDDEIVVVKGSNANDSLFAIYDPVVSTGTAGQIARVTLQERPETVGAGNFDTNVSGDEIVVVRKVVSGESSNNNGSRTIIYKQTTNNGNGANWTVHTARNSDPMWDKINVANIDNTGVEEIGLAGEDASDDDRTKVEVVRPEGTSWQKLYENGSECRPPKAIAFGQYFGGGPLELLQSAVQNCSNSSIQPAFRVFQYNGTRYPEDSPAFQEKFEPEPNVVFTGDITGNGDDEAILMRNVASGTANATRLFVRGNGDDQIITEFINGLPLDDNNSYRTGAAGDIDGDGKDEIVIMRETNIRYYPNANTSASATDFATSTNRRSIAIGDLDKSGGGGGGTPIFATDIAKVEATVNSGFVTTGQITLKNGNTEDGIPFVATVDGTPLWIAVSPTTGIAPGKSSSGLGLTYTIDARLLTPGQSYQSNIRIQNTGTPAASNSPMVIPVTVTVQLPPFELIPAGGTVTIIPCSTASLAPKTLTMTISGRTGSQLRDVQVWNPTVLASMAANPGELFLGARAADGSLALANAAGETATLAASGAMALQSPDMQAMEMQAMEMQAADADAIQATSAITYSSSVPWITAISVSTTTLPAQLTVEVSPTLRTQPFEIASLVLIGPSYDAGNPIAARSYPIRMICTDYAAWLPTLGK